MSAASNSRTDRFATALTNVDRALANLRQSLSKPIEEPRDLSGIIKDFEIVYELSWKLLKKLLEREGHETGSAREAFSKAYQLRLLGDEVVWLKILEDRNLTVHTYNKKFAEEMCARIRQDYVGAFEVLRALFNQRIPPVR